ncbi:MAG: hypothetical protein IKQ97_01110 [Eubacterium sp.]|nr:hypothetical protein [Eubacterium sp.]
MRRTFAEILREGNVDIGNEYKKLYDIMYDRNFENGSTSLHDIIADSFASFYFRGTCLTLDEFDEIHGFDFEENPDCYDVEYLVLFCEYYQNMLVGLQNVINDMIFGYSSVNTALLMEQIRKVIDAIGYMPVYIDGFTIYIEKSPASIAASESELIPKELSYKVLEYNHHSLHGEIEKKKQILLKLAELLEPERENLKNANGALCSDVFYAFNKMNLRHNNINKNNPAKYKLTIALMDKDVLEKWYDEVYQMCLLCFLELEQAERKMKFDKLKAAIEEDAVYEV